MGHGLLFQVFVFLTAMVLSVPLSARLGLGSVVGYLIAGVVIGPQVFGLISDVNAILHFSEFGVVILMFLIGLELSPRRLWDMRRSIVAVGLVQVLATTAVLYVALRLTGLAGPVCVVLAMAGSLSSTAMTLQIYKERNLLSTPAGREGFSVLLMQDIAVIPMLAVLPALAATSSGGAGPTDWWSILRGFLVIGGIIAGGRWLLRPLFRLVAASGVREVFTGLALLLVIGTALLMDSISMSMALGTFLAGVVLADSEYRHELEVDLEPFKGLLLGLFFMSVGMSLNLGVVAATPLTFLAAVVAVMSLKSLVLVLIGKKIARLDPGGTPVFALGLCQVGEFAFVIAALAVSKNILSADQAAFANAVVAFSMVCTPFLFALRDKISVMLQGRAGAAATPADTPEAISNSVVIAGFGRFGQMVGRILHAHHIPTVVLEHDPSQIELLRRFGYKVFYGDARRLDLLHAAGIGDARLFIVAVDDVEAANEIVATARKHYPQLPLVVRARNRVHAFDLMDLGVIHPVREVFDGSLAAGYEALKALGYTNYRAHRAIQKFRLHDVVMLEEGHQARKEGEKGLISRAVQARNQLTAVMTDDRQDAGKIEDSGWG
jgi:glutathione-regulated potassium-efflux system ancillary protein KefC